MLKDLRTADERFPVNPNDNSDDPHYGYHSLSWHAASIAKNDAREARKAARDNARARGLSVKAAA